MNQIEDPQIMFRRLVDSEDKNNRKDEEIDELKHCNAELHQKLENVVPAESYYKSCSQVVELKDLNEKLKECIDDNIERISNIREENNALRHKVAEQSARLHEIYTLVGVK